MAAFSLFRRDRTRTGAASPSSKPLVEAREASATIVPPVPSGPETDDERADAERLESFYLAVQMLRSFALGDADHVDPDRATVQTARALERDERSARSALREWALYYSDQLNDLDVFHRGVEMALSKDPQVVAAVATLAERLLSEADASVSGALRQAS